MASEFKRVGKLGVTVPKNFNWPRKPFAFLDVSGSHIIIEQGVTFSSGIYIWTHDHYFNRSNWRKLPYIKNSKPTIFKKFCFIGVNSIILSKCKSIGKHSVIAAGSVVTKSVPDYEIWAGNPAKKVSKVQKTEELNI